MVNDNREWLSVSDVEEEYGIPAQTQYFWRHTGKGPRTYKPGRRVMYRRSELEAYIESTATA